MMVVSIVFTVLSLIVGIWVTIGSLPGVVFLFLGLFAKHKETQKKYLRYWAYCWGGIPALMVLAALYAIVQLILHLFGISTPPVA